MANDEKKLSDEWGEEPENTSGKYSFLAHQNNELFDDDSYVPQKLISVKRIFSPKKGESWQILENEKVMLILNGTKLTKKEKKALYTPEGLLLLLESYKVGEKSMAKIKKRIKTLIK